MDIKLGKVLLLSIVLTLILISLLGRMTFSVQGLEFEISLEIFNHGHTEIIIPPVGSLSAPTHLTPLRIKVELLNIDLDVLKRIISANPVAEQLGQEIRRELERIGVMYVFRLVLLAIGAGLLAALLITGRQIRPALWSTATALAVCLLLLGVTAATYNPEKLRQPQFKGALQAAPWAVDLAETAFQRIGVLGEQMQVIATNLYTIFERIDQIQPVKEEPGDLLVLHVSDIHNNPAAHRLIEQILGNFPVDLVIDTGDITDYGTPLEANLLKGLADLKIPYVFVPGNHDSPELSKALGKYAQVQVLTGGVVDIQGLRILALADPALGSRGIAPPETIAIAKAHQEVENIYTQAPAKPHLAAIHNYKVAEPLLGRVPLLLYGHSHQYSIQEEQGTVLINAGTSGGAGLRGLQANKEIPYSVVLLHFSRDQKNNLTLTAVDTIKVYNLERGFTLDRKMFNLKLNT